MAGLMALDEKQPPDARPSTPYGAADNRNYGSATATKFRDPDWTAKGERRAVVPFTRYQTIWFNTGTLCNIACENCYIDSSPKNDRLAYLTRSEVRRFLDEAVELTSPPTEIGFTGGEPFMNPDILGFLEDSQSLGFRVVVLTNAMRPMQRYKSKLLALHERFPQRLSLRVSLDHYEEQGHEKLRGPGTWKPAIDGLSWLAANRFDLAVAGRALWDETDAAIRVGYATLFERIGLSVDASDPAQLVLFPEMDEHCDVPDISEGCWSILGKSPGDVMCSNSRMIVKRKGADHPVVVACTLLPYAEAFEMGASLRQSRTPVSLNHSHCARFCVLGGATCSTQK